MEIMMSATLCVIDCPQDADNREKLLEIIDYTLETAKNFSKGKITFASEIDLEKSKSFKNVEKAVKEAIAEERVRVYYQPIFSLKKRRYNCAEALARLYDPKLGWIPPEHFISIAEKSGLIVELGEMIIHKVCSFIRDNKLSETPIEYIEINVSPIQLMQRGFADKMLDIMKQYDVSSKQINVEITETVMMTSFSIVDDNLKRLVESGIAISLDDYGSGYANINYINKMPFELIKIDRAIIQDSFKEKKAGITLEHTVSMLNALEMNIVAEGVETEEMRDSLVGFGCQYLQGWYYSKAVSGNDFMKLISDPKKNT
jgi:EAL domain-containing protein (putative c-di-GMP-specific phosphodiesterase class I)